MVLNFPLQQGFLGTGPMSTYMISLSLKNLEAETSGRSGRISLNL
jgi:hypothetical protein